MINEKRLDELEAAFTYSVEVMGPCQECALDREGLELVKEVRRLREVLRKIATDAEIVFRSDADAALDDVLDRARAALEETEKKT